MQKSVANGGMIQVLYLSKEKQMIIDEEGKLKDKPMNLKATQIAIQHSAIAWHDCVVGDALILEGKALLD